MKTSRRTVQISYQTDADNPAFLSLCAFLLYAPLVRPWVRTVVSRDTYQRGRTAQRVDWDDVLAITRRADMELFYGNERIELSKMPRMGHKYLETIRQRVGLSYDAMGRAAWVTHGTAYNWCARPVTFRSFIRALHAMAPDRLIYLRCFAEGSRADYVDSRTYAQHNAIPLPSSWDGVRAPYQNNRTADVVVAAAREGSERAHQIARRIAELELRWAGNKRYAARVAGVYGDMTIDELIEANELGCHWFKFKPRRNHRGVGPAERKWRAKYAEAHPECDGINYPQTPIGKIAQRFMQEETPFGGPDVRFDRAELPDNLVEAYRRELDTVTAERDAQKQQRAKQAQIHEYELSPLERNPDEVMEEEMAKHTTGTAPREYAVSHVTSTFLVIHKHMLIDCKRYGALRTTERLPDGFVIDSELALEACASIGGGVGSATLRLSGMDIDPNMQSVDQFLEEFIAEASPLVTRRFSAADLDISQAEFEHIKAYGFGSLAFHKLVWLMISFDLEPRIAIEIPAPQGHAGYSVFTFVPLNAQSSADLDNPLPDDYAKSFGLEQKQ